MLLEHLRQASNTGLVGKDQKDWKKDIPAKLQDTQGSAK